MIDADTLARVQAVLNPGEDVHWAGRPGQGIRFRMSDWFIIPWSLLFAGAAFGLAVASWWIEGEWAFRIQTLPFALLAAYFLFGRYVLDAWYRSGLVYAVTGERLVSIWKSRARSMALGNMQVLELIERPRGQGSILFGEGFPYNRHRFLLPSADGKSFEFIEDSRAVYGIINRARAGGAKPEDMMEALRRAPNVLDASEG
jgi:hypothetical protein